MKYKDKLFALFSRLHTSDQYPGTGIGLALCKKIVDRHNGRIWLESSPGNGTSVLFTIPA
jgi:signal transduction histidine kinase